VDRLLDVLDLLRPKITKARGQRFPDLSVSVTGNAHPSGLSDPLQARGYVDPIAQKVATSNHHVPDMDADAEAECTIHAYASVHVTERLLDLDGTLDGIDGGGKFGQYAVACGVGDPAPMLRNEPVHDLTVSRESTEGPHLVLAHQPGV
jgi:hypothetical protein